MKIAMRFERDHLIFKALCVLQDASERTDKAPIQGTAGLRFALAFLWTVSERKDRKVFDEFWTIVTGQGRQHANPHTAEYMRATYARTCLCGISRSVGMEYTVDLSQALSQAIKPKPKTDD